MCTRVEDVEPVADSVVTRRRAEARSRSEGRMRLYVNHISSESSGKRVMVPEPSRSIACLIRRILLEMVLEGETVGRSVVVEGDRGIFSWGQTDTSWTSHGEKMFRDDLEEVLTMSRLTS